MASERSISTPAAILIGSALIAVGVFFGLRQRPLDDRSLVESPAPSSRSAPGSASRDAVAAPSPASRDAVAAPSPTSRDAVAAPGPASQDIVAAQVTKALEAYRGDIIERCWKPSVAKQPKPPTTKIVYNFSFDSSGRQIIRGAREDRETSRPEVRQCIDGILKPLQIETTGTSVFVEVPFTLP
jgi:hypothetical protein